MMVLFNCSNGESEGEETVGLTSNVEGLDSGNEEQNDASPPDEEMKDSPGQRGQSSNLQTSWNILNLIQGMGTLGIPYAIKTGGLSSIIYIVVIAVITCHTGGLIIEAQYDESFEDYDEEKKKTERLKPRAGYASVGRAVWTDYGSRIVSTVQLIHLLGACILYLILVANFLEAIFPKVLLNENQCMLLAGVLVFPTAFLSNLSNIAWLSLTSIASLNVVFTVLICYSLKEVREWRVSSLPVANLEGTSIAVCIIMFSYVAHPYLPKIEGNMKKPQQFKFVTNIAFTIATITKIIFGFTLACHYGADTKQRVTSNVKTYQLKLCIDALLALSGLFSFALPLNVIMNIIQKSELKLFAMLFPIFRSKQEMTWSEKGLDLAMRVILVCATTAIAMMLPEFSLLMAIFGSVTAVCLVILFPIHFYAKLHREKMSVRSMLLNYSIAVLFVGVGATGFITSIQALREALKTAET